MLPVLLTVHIETCGTVKTKVITWGNDATVQTQVILDCSKTILSGYFLTNQPMMCVVLSITKTML
jgi:hypothetical protein